DGLLRLGTRDVDLPPEERARRFQRMQDAVLKLEQLITRLLDVSRLRAGGPQLDPRPFDLAEAVRETCERMAKTVSASGSSLDVDTEPTPGSWDRGGIDQILVNLLSNAAKYGAGKPIRVKVSSDDVRARIVVQDEGIGVAAEDQKRIFLRFERAVSSRSYGGFGLGLWIASEIARASGGGIEVASRPGEGATFTVTLPR
ncbi:MAG TPA: HAMP domain-containing sensor histidine kinase, partial [Polyangiaceae bacterium]